MLVKKTNNGTGSAYNMKGQENHFIKYSGFSRGVQTLTIKIANNIIVANFFESFIASCFKSPSVFIINQVEPSNA